MPSIKKQNIILHLHLFKRLKPFYLKKFGQIQMYFSKEKINNETNT